MGETSICQVRATVMTYDDASKRWVVVGSDAPAAAVSHSQPPHVNVWFSHYQTQKLQYRFAASSQHRLYWE
ncbi:hypothetical protein CRUP_027039, partial [Coryphaenoides rupestris]